MTGFDDDFEARGELIDPHQEPEVRGLHNVPKLTASGKGFDIGPDGDATYEQQFGQDALHRAGIPSPSTRDMDTTTFTGEEYGIPDDLRGMSDRKLRPELAEIDEKAKELEQMRAAIQRAREIKGVKDEMYPEFFEPNSYGKNGEFQIIDSEN